MKVWLIADTHLNHENIKTYCQRPDDFTKRIVHNWRRMVGREDLLIHLGDVVIGKKNSEGWLNLPGRKVLIIGNHDQQWSATAWMRHGFDFACHGLIFRNAWLTHEPAEALPAGTEINIHGHKHNVWDGFQGGGPYEPKSFHRLFAVEYTGYAPVEFDKFVRNSRNRYKAVGPAWPRAETAASDPHDPPATFASIKERFA